MVPLYACRIEDLGPSDFLRWIARSGGHTALLAPAFPFRLGLEPRDRVLDYNRGSGAGAAASEVGRLSASNGRSQHYDFARIHQSHCINALGRTSVKWRTSAST
jgi:hypothetical protein